MRFFVLVRGWGGWLAFDGQCRPYFAENQRKLQKRYGY